MIKKVLIAFALQIPALALAGTCDPLGCTGKVKTLYPHGSTGHVYVEIYGNASALNCNLFQGTSITLKQTNKRFAEIYSMLLTASITEKEVRVRIVENTPDCELLYTILSS